MKRMIENLTGNYGPSASVVDGTLVISLPDAVSPVVWRLDLGQARASAMEVRAHDSGTFTLILKTPRGDVNDIASFPSKPRALAALMAIGRAMEQAHGQVRPVANDVPPQGQTGTNTLPVPVRTAPMKKKRNSKGIVAGLVAVVLIVVLIGALMNVAPMPSSTMSTMTSAATGLTQAAAPGAAAKANNPNSTGIPVSADDFLKGR